MFITDEAVLTEAPPYSREMVDTVMSKYCTIDTVIKEKTVTRNINGIVVTKRKNAILRSLQPAPKPAHVFGELEMEALRTTY